MDNPPLLSQRVIAVAYDTDPAQSRTKVFHQIQAHFPAATEERLRAVLNSR